LHVQDALCVLGFIDKARKSLMRSDVLVRTIVAGYHVTHTLVHPEVS
jgi:hypothetical protein